MKKGDKVICLIDFPPIPGIINMVTPKEGDILTVRSVERVFNPDIKAYIDSITTDEIENKNLSYKNSPYKSFADPNENMAMAAQYFKLL